MRRNYSCTVAEDAGYQGRNRFLRWWPKVLLIVAVAVIFMGWNHTVQFTTLLCLIAYVHGRWLPWQFTIGEGAKYADNDPLLLLNIHTL